MNENQNENGTGTTTNPTAQATQATQAKKPSLAERVSSTSAILSNTLRKASIVSNSGSFAGITSGVPSSLSMAQTLSSSSSADSSFSMSPDDYKLDQVIGQGSSAIVYLATYQKSSSSCEGKPQKVSIKVIDLDMFERNQIDELRRELQIMTLSKHPNLLPVHGSFVNGSKLFIVTPFLSAGSGLDIMKTAFQRGMEESVIATILKQVLQGLEYLHSHGLIHRDIKAGNLLVGSDGLVQLADFGVSSTLTDHGSRGASRKTFVGTPCWMAPEVMDQSGYDYKADIWSFGITALELANGHAPYAKFPPMKVLMLTLQNPSPTLDRDSTMHKYTKSFKDMIDSCLQKDPTKRPSAEKLLAHPFFKSAKKPAFLVTSLLNGLTPITERAHLQKNMDTVRSTLSDQNEEWDFGTTGNSTTNDTTLLDQPQEERDQDPTPPPVFSSSETVQNSSTTGKPRVSFKPVAHIVPNTPMSSEPAESGTLLRSSTLERSSVGSEAARTVSLASSEGSVPRKSRFTVDGTNPVVAVATRTDSSVSNVVESLVPVQPTPVVVASGQTSPNLSGSGAGGVKKGRFSVIDSNPTAITLPPAAASTVLTVSPVNDAVPDEGSERKAGRFAFQNLPTSALTSPVLAASEGPKVSRKFTIVSSESVPTNGNVSPTRPASAADGKRGSRFQVVGGNEEAVISAASASLVAPVPSVPEDVLKMVETQRMIIADLLAMLRPGPASRTSSSESGIATNPADE